MSRAPYRYCPHCRMELEPREHGGRQRPSCPDSSCGFVSWENPVPVVAAIVQCGNEVVLVRSHGWPETWYGLVAGFVEAGERVEQAVLREVREEIGLEPHAASFLGSYPFQRMNQILFVFHVEIDDDEIRLSAEELAAYKRVRIDELLPWSRGTGLAVRDWLRSRGLEREPVEFGEHVVQSSSPVNEKS